MDYIVVDFEWNQSSYGKGSEKKKLPFEIIEIGAVKLDENRQVLDTFDVLIRPKVYKKLYYITQDLTGINQKELDHGASFPETIVDFMLWCGDDFMFCTWGDTDLIELQRNMKYYRLLDLLPGPLSYYNVQKLFQKFFSTQCETQQRQVCSLEEAVDFCQLDKQETFHRAIHDAHYTAEIFSLMDPGKIKTWFSVDYYQNPQTKAEEIHLSYDTYSKYISREFISREEALRDKEVSCVRCYLCNRNARKMTSWFLGKGRDYYCVANCREHGLLVGKIRFRKTDEGHLYVVKTVRACPQEEAMQLRQMKAEVTEKRRERRHREA